MHYSIEHPPPVVYALCCTSRSGSTYLCELLCSTRRLGQPDEYLNADSLARWRSSLELPADCLPEEYIARLLDRQTVAGVFGVKAVPEALDRLEAFVEPTHYLWLRRRDTLRQAISLYRASHSGVWQARGSDSPGAAVPFDSRAIRQVRGWIEATNRHWQQRFDAEQRPLLPLWYEDVCRQPQEVVQRIGRFLERPLPEGLVAQATTRVMRDEVTEQWARKLAA